MSTLQLDWTEELSTDGLLKALHLVVLGYVVEIIPVRYFTKDTPHGFRAFSCNSGSLEQHVICMLAETVEAAKQAVEAWLSREMRAVEPAGIGQLPMSTVRATRGMQVEAGLGYAMQFASALMPYLEDIPHIVTVSAFHAEDGSTGLYFCNENTGQGVKVTSAPGPGGLWLYSGSRAELEHVDDAPGTYFDDSDIPVYARVAAEGYLS
jgi:hypothetical protein